MQSALSIRRYYITGSQRLSNYLWASFLSFSGIGFLVTGFSSFLERGTVANNSAAPLLSAATSKLDFRQVDLVAEKTIAFFPQGLIMCFYGSLGLLFGIYLWCTVLWKVGNGFNEFDTDSGILRIFRWGLPGKDRRIDLKYKMKEIDTLRVELKEGLSPRRTISVQIKGKGEIPLTAIGQPRALQDIESEASELAQFLQVSLETFYKM